MQFPPASRYCGLNPSCQTIETAREEWSAVARAVAEFEKVVVYANPNDVELAQSMCGSSVSVVPGAVDDGWSRDSGPMLLTHADARVRAACFQFNGWGGSYSYENDALIKWQMTEDLGLQVYNHDMVLEGGSVIMDGTGALVTTQQCLLHDGRNPELSQDAQSQILKEQLGVDRVIWLPGGWSPDPITNGHVDGIAAFVAENTLVLNSVSQSGDPDNYQMLEQAREILEGEGFEVIRLPATSFTAFHINFYTANGGLIVPIQGRAQVDDTPLGILRELHPNHQVVGVVANTLGEAGGGVHCITQQVPDGVCWPF
jgi:agmatine deiminase